MDKEIVILGASPFGSLMRQYVEKSGHYRVVAYAVEESYIKSCDFDNRPLVPIETIKRNYSPQKYNLLNTLGYVQMNGVRHRFFDLGKQMGYDFVTYVHPSAVVNSPLGEGCIVLENVSIGFRNTIGDGNLFWMGSIIAHDCRIGNFTYWGPGATSCGNTTVGNHCFIGAQAVLRNRIQVADECLIGAGVYLNRSIDIPKSVFRAPYPEKHPLCSTEIY